MLKMQLPFTDNNFTEHVSPATQTCYQLMTHDDAVQSAYRRHHSTEIAILIVYNDIIRAVDRARLSIRSTTTAYCQSSSIGSQWTVTQ